MVYRFVSREFTMMHGVGTSDSLWNDVQAVGVAFSERK